MKPENKIPVLTRLSDEMKAVVNFQQPGLPPSPADGDIEIQRQYYLLERRFWNADAPPMPARTCAVPMPYGDVTTRIYSPQPTSQATLYYLHGGGFILGNLDTHDRIMRLLARYTGCTVIGIDYSLSPQARYPQAIEETVAVCRYFSQHANEYSLNVEKIGFAGDSAGAMLSLASALWLRDKQISCGNVIAILLWYGLYGLQDSVSRRLFGGAWDGLTREDLEMYEKAYLRNEEDRESPWYCLFNNDLTRNVPPCFIASAEFDPLIDDSRLLYQTLQAHRQPCEYKMYPGTLHAFLHYSRMMKSANDALQDGARFFIARIKMLR
ncbi:acetyl esterase [Salmonella enterica]|nr:acetyl esterase [Salmonella enterica]ECG9225113.1 acetyl esterase [Salmonella enterica]EDO2517758.1 acetyl esterase [Salmonella enterica subsp. enterica]EDS2496621.1 acetyl esterase [Salmonella enterica subsp. arizonae serovar 51:z4,z23:-]EJW3191983.1 acetyl esterase [Salmonella enterica]